MISRIELERRTREPVFDASSEREVRKLSEQIAAYAQDHLTEKKYVPLSDGHLRTVSTGEGRRYDSNRNAFINELQIGREETLRYEGESGGTAKLCETLRIGPYELPWVTTEIEEKMPGGGIGRRTSAHRATPIELQGFLHDLTTGFPTDPRANTWRTPAKS